MNIKVLWISRLDDLHMEFLENMVIGDLEKIFWSDSGKIANSLTNILNEIGIKSETVSYLDINPAGKSKSIVGKKITIELINKEIKIDNLVIKFLSGITKFDYLQYDFYMPESNLLDGVIEKEVESFLLKNGNKKIKQPLEIKCGDNVTKLVGSYASITPTVNENSPPELHSGFVDGLVKHTRNVYLKLLNQKIVVSYFEPVDFELLLSLLKSNEEIKFTLQERVDAGGKKDIYLSNIEINNSFYENSNFLV